MKLFILTLLLCLWVCRVSAGNLFQQLAQFPEKIGKAFSKEMSALGGSGDNKGGFFGLLS